MKKLYLLIAFFACLEMAMLPGKVNASPLQDFDESIEATIDDLGDDVGEALEKLANSLGDSAEELGAHLEEWAEEHSEELDEWSEKYAHKWEAWADGMERRMEGFSADQEQVWGLWAKRYEQKWERWGDQMDAEEFDAEDVGELVKRNLEMLSEMPLGQMVDQLVDEGLSELADAPWESIDELADLAKSALKEPLAELSEMSREGSPNRRAIEEGLGDLQDTLGRMSREVEQRIDDRMSDKESANDRDRRSTRGRATGGVSDRQKIQAQIRGVKALLEREDLSGDQRTKLEQLYNTLSDAESLMGRERDEGRIDDRRSQDSRMRDTRDRKRAEIQEQIEREKQRHEDTLQQFNDDLRRSSEESRRAEDRRRELDSRNPKRVDGKNLDAESKRDRDLPNTRQNRRDQGARANRSSSSKTNSTRDPSVSEVDLLRREIEILRKELQSLKNDRR